MKNSYIEFEEEVKEAPLGGEGSANVHSVGQSMIARFNSNNIGNESNPVISGRMAVLKSLMEMGFPQIICNNLLNHTEVNDITTAVEMITKTENGWLHKFVPDRGNRFCSICNESRNEHIEERLQLEDERNTGNEVVIRMGRESPFAERIHEEERKGDLECKICTQSNNQENMFALSCKHYYCISCVNSYLEANINDGKILNLKCPEETCNIVFKRSDISSICTPSTFAKYEKFKENIEINLNKKLRWCPAPNCGKYVEENPSTSHAICKCGFHLCFKCGEAWHEGITCEDFFDKLYKKWAVDKIIQRCPNCNIRVEKNQGCNHMTCSLCSYAWCWICGMKYSDEHYYSTFFGCPGMQFTSSDWGMGKIFFYLLAQLIFWPLICLFLSFPLVCEWVIPIVEVCPMPFRLLIVIPGLAPYLIMVVLVATAMLIPSFVYKIYTLGYTFVRLCKKQYTPNHLRFNPTILLHTCLLYTSPSPRDRG
eukprot:TRINITY_DN18393_c0_g1_i1.p1 TRINITY_DN18393_c0_g1~~TRINITY_DN18393_c0_g1_i1.p1  ORF type:complete len:482 (+),score=47.08 TRINITY_DN18393_c0_g1_i1:1-1446(+)